MIKKYVKKPIEIEAIQYLGDNLKEVEDFIDQTILVYTNTDTNEERGMLGIPTLEGIMQASIGDYIIKGVRGEYYPCKPDIFKLTYDEV